LLFLPQRRVHPAHYGYPRFLHVLVCLFVVAVRCVSPARQRAWYFDTCDKARMKNVDYRHLPDCHDHLSLLHC
jgi:hypothetical protein